MANAPYRKASVSSSSTCRMKNVLTRGNTDPYMDVLPPVNQNLYLMANVPYTTASGSSSSTYKMKNVLTPGNTDYYVDVFNCSK